MASSKVRRLHSPQICSEQDPKRCRHGRLNPLLTMAMTKLTDIPSDKSKGKLPNSVSLSDEFRNPKHILTRPSVLQLVAVGEKAVCMYSNTSSWRPLA